MSRSTPPRAHRPSHQQVGAAELGVAQHRAVVDGEQHGRRRPGCGRSPIPEPTACSDAQRHQRGQVRVDRRGPRRAARRAAAAAADAGRARRSPAASSSLAEPLRRRPARDRARAPARPAGRAPTGGVSSVSTSPPRLGTLGTRTPAPARKNAAAGPAAVAVSRARHGRRSWPNTSIAARCGRPANCWRSCSARNAAPASCSRACSWVWRWMQSLTTSTSSAACRRRAGLGGLVAGVGDVREDRGLGPVAGLDVGERLVEQLGHLASQSTDRTSRRVASSFCAQRLGVLHGAVAGLLGGEPRVAQPAAADQVLQLHLGRDLRRLDVGVERADQHVDRLVGRAQVHLAVRGGHLDEQLEVEAAAHVAPVGGEACRSRRRTRGPGCRR